MQKSGQMDQTLQVKTSHRFPVVEVFGPTIQGEGIDQGVPCYFVRFGGCDYKCDWCDSPHAVLPHLVRQSERLDNSQIIEKIRALPQSARWVILSGGNPLLHELGPLIDSFHDCGYRVSVETQGTRWKQWLLGANRVAVSPKPPSSGHTTDFEQLDHFMWKLNGCWNLAFLKVVVFDLPDFEYAKGIHKRYPEFPMFLSAGNDAGSTVGNPDRIDTRNNMEVSRDLIFQGRWLANRTMIDPDLWDVRVQMQQHVLYWANEKGR